MQATQLKHGDFTQLAEMYSLYRPGYAQTVLQAMLGICQKPVNMLDVVDVGAGTGIWTRMLANSGVRSTIAVEPNTAMREKGMQHPQNGQIRWIAGSGEKTTLPDNSVDLVSMASSFHWVDFAKGTQEFHRILREGGHFVALWNPRHIDDQPLLVDIEKKIYLLSPHVKRVSSGKSQFVSELSQRLLHSPYFTDLTYLEGRHTVALTPQQYMGAWYSVNDIRAQMGEEKFGALMDFIHEQVASLESIPCTYLTRAWVVRKK
jgi:ubiquinone/menaquinone biosynthesis C-methylase UbiE